MATGAARLLGERRHPLAAVVPWSIGDTARIRESRDAARIALSPPAMWPVAPTRSARTRPKNSEWGVGLARLKSNQCTSQVVGKRLWSWRVGIRDGTSSPAWPGEPLVDVLLFRLGKAVAGAQSPDTDRRPG